MRTLPDPLAPDAKLWHGVSYPRIETGVTLAREDIDMGNIVASMNPYDNVGTTRLSTSVHDRMCRLVVDYQDDSAEREIVSRRADPVTTRVVADAVAVTRATRDRDDIRQGSSVRGAIDLAMVTTQLCAMRGVGVPAVDTVDPPRDLPTDYTGCFLDAMLVALSGRIHLDDTAFSTPEAILVEIWQDHFLLSPAAAEPG